MKPLGVVEPEIFPEVPGKIPDVLIVVQIEPFVLEGTPETFHEDVIESPSPAVHADSNVPFLQRSEKRPCW